MSGRELAGRYELKYFLPFDLVSVVRRWATPYVEPDPHAKLDSEGIPRYTIRSVYLDSRELRFYYEKMEGALNRRKFRIRAYTRPTARDSVFLEIKYRDNTQVSKDRTKLTLEYAEALLDRQVQLGELDLPFVERKSAERFVYYCRLLDLQPVVTVTYDRTAYVGRTDDTVRFTIDVNLRLEDQRNTERLFDARPEEPVPLPGAILELKFNRLMPEWMRQLVSRFDIAQESISKYSNCVDAAVFREYMMS